MPPRCHLRKYAPATAGTLAAWPPSRERLAARTLELVDIPSESRHEAAIRAHLRSLVPAAVRAGLRGRGRVPLRAAAAPGTPLVVLVGHYDTVPAQDNVPGRIDDGAVHGCGATDMKGGVAVALELVRELADGDPGAVDVALLLFGKEELPPQYNPLPDLFERSPLVHEADLAILLEPTDLTIQAGCLGNLTARVTFHGVQRPLGATLARPTTRSTGRSTGLAAIAALERREAVVGGLPFYEVVSVTRLEAGIADNVIPDRAVATLNFRYPPDRTPDEAEELVRSLVPDGATLEIIGDSPPAAVVTDTPLVRALRDAGDLPFEPKQAWTNVADFTTRGIDAVNFGPGATRYAHRATSTSRSTRSSARTSPCATSSASVDRRASLSPILPAQATYPFVRLNQAAAERRAQGLEVIDFGMGDPREPTDPAIIEALRDGVRERMGYPAAVGLPGAARGDRRAGSARRFGVALDPDAHVIPTLGSKEAIFSFAQVVLDLAGGRDTVVVTEPGYPVPGRGAPFAGARVVELPLLEQQRLPARPRRRARRAVAAHGARLGQLPEQPDRRDRTARASTSGSRRSRASTTSCSPPTRRTRSSGSTSRRSRRSSSPTGRTSSVFNTLSKRSSMTGFRSGFVAGDPALIAALRQFRPNVGTAPQEFVQRASVVAWGDEEHVERARASLRAEAGAVPRPLRPQGPPRRRRAGDDVPLGRGARRRDVGGARRAAARARRARRARRRSSGLRRGLRPLRARAHRGGVRPRRRDPGGCRSR